MLINLEGRTEIQTVNCRPCRCMGGTPWGLTVGADGASGGGVFREGFMKAPGGKEGGRTLSTERLGRVGTQMGPRGI